MTILAAEPDILPPLLLSEEFLEGKVIEEPSEEVGDIADRIAWYALQTKARSEKQLMRHLRMHNICHYAPVVAKRYRSPAGRFRTSYIPLFSNYVFMLGTNDDRYTSLTTNNVVKTITVLQPEQLVADLRQIQAAVAAGIALTPEKRLMKGQRVLVKTGAFAGYEGMVIRREHKTRLLLTVDFLEQGVSMEIDECQIEPIYDKPTK